MGPAEEGKHMVLTHGVHVNILDNDHLLVFFLEFGSINDIARIVAVSHRHVMKGLCHPDRCLFKTFPLGVFTKQLQDPVINGCQLLDIPCIPRLDLIVAVGAYPAAVIDRFNLFTSHNILQSYFQFPLS